MSNKCKEPHLIKQLKFIQGDRYGNTNRTQVQYA